LDAQRANDSADGIDKHATMSRRPRAPHPTEIYAKRQSRRPHYLARLMDKYGASRADLIETLEVDKGLLSRWLDEEKPTTPSPAWADKLGKFFGKGHDPVDIFADPDVDWIARRLRGRPPEEIDRIIAIIDAAYPPKRA
jgi:hypothetical protein